jgi:type I protein arginine methyltransferase
MTSLTRTTTLRRIPDLHVDLSAAGDVLAVADGRIISCGPHGLAILDFFSEPATFADCLDALGARVGGAQDWIDLTAAVVRLHEAGILRSEAASDQETHAVVRGSFDSPGPHVTMLEDRVRTSAFLAALEEVVEADDVVVDIGTGTGVLAAGAARAGARHVYAVEATPIARHARAVFRANELEDRVTLVEGWSTRVTLPERADLVVAEILGSEALEERMLPVLLDARRRLLKPGGLVMPSSLRIFGQVVAIPEERVSSITFTRSNTARWSAWYGLQLTALADYAARLRHRFTAPIEDVRVWQTLTDPVLLAEFDLRQLETPRVNVVVPAIATQSALASGAFAFFEAQLSPGVVLSTNPGLEPSAASWGLPVWLFAEPVELRVGQELELEYEYRDGTGHLRLAAGPHPLTDQR